MTTLCWASFAFFCGSLPFSVWVGRLALQQDIRQYGDHNPGSANVYRAGGPTWGVLAVILDFFKGAIPVAIANYTSGLEGFPLVTVALAPILGHAFSPFLRFRGGKALAVTFGVWAGLSIWLVPTIMGLAFAVWLSLLDIEGWAVLAGLISLLVVMLIIGVERIWLFIWLGNTLILLWKHRQDLTCRPRLRLFKEA